MNYKKTKEVVYNAIGGIVVGVGVATGAAIGLDSTVDLIENHEMEAAQDFTEAIERRKKQEREHKKATSSENQVKTGKNIQNPYDVTMSAIQKQNNNIKNNYVNKVNLGIGKDRTVYKDKAFRSTKDAIEKKIDKQEIARAKQYVSRQRNELKEKRIHRRTR